MNESGRPSRVLPRAAALVLAILILGGCAGPAPQRQFVDQAERLHRDALAAGLSQDADLNEYLAEVGGRLMEGAREAVPRKVQNELFSRVAFVLVDSDVPNAVTTGGPYVYFYQGLFRRCETEEELAAALAHALAHAINLDVQNVGLRPDPNRPLPLVAYGFVTNRFTPAQEQAADDLAFTLYARGGWDPQRFSTLFRRFEDLYPLAPAPGRLPLGLRAGAVGTRVPSVPREWRRPPVADPRTFTALRGQARSAGSAGMIAPQAELFFRAFPNCVLPADLPEQREAQDRLRPPPPQAVPLEPS